MYAIIETGGKQYKVQEGNIIDVELLDTKQDGKFEFQQVLLLNDGTNIKVGNPHLNKCIVKAELIDQVKGPKVIAYKYKRRKNYRRKKGHRQKYTRVKITEITLG